MRFRVRGKPEFAPLQLLWRGESTVNVVFIVVMAYTIITLLIGFVLTKRSTSAGELFTARDQLKLIPLVVLLFGEIVAASSTTGTAQGAYSQGISAFWVFGGRGLGAILFAIFLSEFYTQAGKHGCMSIPEAFKFRFDEKTRIVTVIVIFIPLMLMCSAQCRACASVLSPMIGVDVTTLIYVIGILFGVLALTGIKGIANMNVLHCAILFFGVFGAMIACINYMGGFEAVTSRVPEGYLDLLYPNALKIGGDFISSTLAFTIAVAPVSACYNTTNTKLNRNALNIVGVLTALYAIFPVIIGLCGVVALPGIDPNTVIYQMPSLVSPVLSIIVSIAVLSAVVSSAPFLFLQASTILTRDIVGLVKKDMDQKQQLKMAYVLVLFVTAVAIFFALNTSTIFSQIIGAAHIKATAATVLIVSLYWKRLTNNAAFWAELITGVLAMVFFFSGSVFGFAIEPFWPTLAISAFLMIVVTLIDRKHQFVDWEDFQKRWAESEEKYQLSLKAHEERLAAEAAAKEAKAEAKAEAKEAKHHHDA